MSGAATGDLRGDGPGQGGVCRKRPAGRVVRVLPEVPGLDRELAYLVPERFDREVGVGSRVRVPLGGRVVSGFVVAEGHEAPEGVALRPIAGTRGLGPSPELVALSRWAAWRYAGRRAAFLAAASPPRVVRELPLPAPPAGGRARRADPRWAQAAEALVDDGIAEGRCVLRWPPSGDLMAILEAALARLSPGKSALVLVPERVVAAAVAEGLREGGVPVALLPDEWAAAAAGGRVVVGTRGAAFGPAPSLGLVVVLGAHDGALKEERAPTWDAWVVAAERARRSEVPCLLVSPCPRLEQLTAAPLLAPARADERAGWPPIRIVDRRGEDPRSGLFSPPLVALVRRATPEAPVLCVLNRTGRARLLACARCGELVLCERCGGPVGEPGSGAGSGAEAEPDERAPGAVLRCRRCGLWRPKVCAHCGSLRVRALVPGLQRVEEELTALAGRPVAVVTRASRADEPIEAPVVVGTEAVLHRVAKAAAVAFLDFDQELLRPRVDATEEALALLARAGAAVGGRHGGGMLLVQTRLPRHEVLSAALHADPSRLAEAELERRRALRLPPVVATARVSGPAAGAFVEGLRSTGGLEVLGPLDDGFVLRAATHRALCDALAEAPRPGGRLRVEVDPRRL